MISVPYTDLKPLIHTHIHAEWRQEWDFQPNSKLHKIYPNVHCMPPLSSQFRRRDRVIHNRLRIGRSYSTHSYLLHKDTCHSHFLIEHILTECIDFQPIYNSAK